MIHFLLNYISEYWWVVLIPITFKICINPKVKGILGEFFVNMFLFLALDRKKYISFKNITLPTFNGTTQIDHIIISKYGVFVIETKNYKGKIYGNVHMKEWIQETNDIKFPFQNPLIQNFKHVKVLEELLQIKFDKFISLVVFAGAARFKVKMPKNVVYANKLIPFIKKKKNEILTNDDLQNIIETINLIRLNPSKDTDLLHVQMLKIKQKNKVKTFSWDYLVCPKCGNKQDNSFNKSKASCNVCYNVWVIEPVEIDPNINAQKIAETKKVNNT